MPPTVLRRTDSDPLKRYWWVILLLVLCAGGAILSMMPSGSGVSTAGTEAGLAGAGAASEQSLDSIDQGLATVGAPGTPMNLTMEGAYRRSDPFASTQKSSLFVAASGNVAPGGAKAAVSEAGSAAGGGSLAEALKNIAKRPSKSDNKGWGAAAARSGFTQKAAMAKMTGLSGAAGGGGSSASMSVGGGASAFGITGSNPGSAPTVGGGEGVVGGGPPKVRKGGHNQAFDILKQVEKNASKSAGAGADLAANLGAKGYDGASLKTGAGAPGLTGLGGGQVVGAVDAIPENLKLDDPKLQKKEIKVPEVGKDKDAKTGPDMEQQMMMMLMQAAIAGIAGPMFGAIGAGMASAVFNTKVNYNPTGSNYLNNCPANMNCTPK